MRAPYLIAGVVAVLAAGAASAQSSAAPAPHPCREAPEYRQFDFWVGEWTVSSGDRVAGHNRIETRSDGCLLLESWQGSGGSSGHSVNYFDPATRTWNQLWVGSGGGFIRGSGGLADGAMKLVGEHVLADGERRPFRMTFTPNEDGTVRQLLEESADGGATWSVWFDGLYAPADR